MAVYVAAAGRLFVHLYSGLVPDPGEQSRVAIAVVVTDGWQTLVKLVF